MASTRKGSIVKCEEALGKNTIAEIEAGISCASEAIERFKNDAKLYLLRAKLSFKLLVILKFHGKVDARIKNCLGDCEQAIAFIERGLMKGDSTTAKVEALQLGYLCCEKLKDSQQKKTEFDYRLKEFGIEMPANTDQVRNKLIRLFPGGQHGSSITRVYKLQEMLFPKASFIDPLLLEDVIRCYKERQIVCRNCYYNDTKLSRGYNAKGECTGCQWEFKNLLVIPKSPMTINYYMSDLIAIPPWPKSKPNDLPFESCAKSSDRSLNHKRCLIMSRNSAVWYAHTVEELVIWTIEREHDCSFEEFIRDREPVCSATVAAAAAAMPYQNIYPLPQVPTVYYPQVITCQAGVAPSYSVPVGPYPAGYMDPQLLPTTVGSHTSSFPFSYQVPICHLTTFYSAPVTATQLQTKSMVHRFNNMTFSSPPISPVVVDDNQQPVASTTTNNEDTVSD